jgi:hypothetical protein
MHKSILFCDDKGHFSRLIYFFSNLSETYEILHGKYGDFLSGKINSNKNPGCYSSKLFKIQKNVDCYLLAKVGKSGLPTSSLRNCLLNWWSAFESCDGILFSCSVQGCQIWYVYFHTKTPNLSKFWRDLNGNFWNFLKYLMAIW